VQNKRVLNWRFTLALIKINYGQIGDQTGLFYTTNPVFYTSGNRFVRRTRTFGNLIFYKVMVFNTTFNNISVILCRLVLLVDETGENHRPVASH
jgi:hypothetical protein